MKFEVMRSNGTLREGDYDEVIESPPFRFKKEDGTIREVEMNAYVVNLRSLRELIAYRHRIGFELILDSVGRGSMPTIEIYDGDREHWRR